VIVYGANPGTAGVERAITNSEMLEMITFPLEAVDPADGAFSQGRYS
jgi:hypothetical protein